MAVPGVYERITLQMSPTERRTVWADGVREVPTGYMIRVCAADGTPADEVILAHRRDVLRRLPAVMNLHYGALEVSRRR